jgi:hypothetical protein
MTARPLAIPRPRPHLRVVPGRPTPAPRLAPWVFFTTVALLAFFGLIFSRIALDRSAFVLEELEDQIALEEVRYQGFGRTEQRCGSIGREPPPPLGPAWSLSVPLTARPPAPT